MVGLILHYLGSENIISLLYSLAHIYVAWQGIEIKPENGP